MRIIVKIPLDEHIIFLYKKQDISNSTVICLVTEHNLMSAKTENHKETNNINLVFALFLFI